MKNKLIALLIMSALAVGTLAGCGNTAATDTAASAADTVAETPSRLSAQQLLRLLKLLTQPQTVQTNMQIFPVPSACPVPLPWKSWQMQLQKASWKNIPT